MDINNKVVEHIKVSHEALAIADNELKKQAEKARAYEKLIPDVVEALVKHERIDKRDAEKAAQVLRDPAEALKILARTADTTDTVRPRALGHAAKSAAKSSGNGNFCGRVSDASQADEELRRRWLG
jgi:hypothetical protein